MSGKRFPYRPCLRACLLVIGILMAVSTLPDAAPHAGATDCPGDVLRHLRDGNRVKARPSISPYDPIIRRNAERNGMDWRFLAAVIREESQFRADAVSTMEAKGLMQLRDITAAHFGFDPEEIDLLDPDTNIRLGSRLLAELQKQFRREGMDPDNVLRFSLASYHCGSGMLDKRRTEAAEEGLDPNDWEAVASVFSRYSPLTPAYVEAVENTYARYRAVIPSASYGPGKPWR